MEQQGFPLSFMAESSCENSVEQQGFPLAESSSQNCQPFNINDFQGPSSFYSDSSFHHNSASCSCYDEFLNPNDSPIYPVTQTLSFPQSNEGLEDSFNLLSLSNNNDPPMFVADGDSNRLHRMRVESAARGQQIDFYNNPPMFVADGDSNNLHRMRVESAARGQQIDFFNNPPMFVADGDSNNLHRMRVESAARGQQIDFFNNPPMFVADGDSNNLHRMRVESAARAQQIDFYNNPPMFVADSDSNHLHRMRVESAARGQQIDFYNEGFLGNFPRTPMADVFRRSRSFDEVAYASSRRSPINNIDLQLGPRWGNHSTWGLESPNPNNHPQEWLRFSPLNDLKGRVSSVAKDQNACRLLQKEFDNGMISRQVIDMILPELKIDLHELMVHQVANYLIRKTFKASNHQQRTELLLVLVTREQRFLEVCTDTHGSRALQNIIEQITSQEHRSIILPILRHIAVFLVKDIHGHHILERCFQKFSDEDTKHIVDQIANNFLEIATDKGGCFVLQQGLVHVNAKVRDLILAEVVANAFLLSGDRYGNYVIQYILAIGLPNVTSQIIMQLRGSYVTFSTNKFGSNVVEKCLKFSGHDDFCMIIKEIMLHNDFVKVIQDAYGNYVVQSALKLSKGDLHKTLVRFILSHHQVLHSHLYGKMVMDRIKYNKNRVQYN